MIKQITVSGIESNNGKIVLCEQEPGKKYPTKYSFFQNWPDGNMTETYEQFLAKGVKIGETYLVEIKEVQGINRNNGKPVTYRNIVSFDPSGEPDYQKVDDGSRIDKMAKWAVDMASAMSHLTSRVDAVEAEIAGLKAGKPGSDAYELHKALDTPIKQKILTQPEIPTVQLDDLEEANMDLDTVDPTEEPIDEVPF